jgi:imidazolonepropionase-like amidohydrolase
MNPVHRSFVRRRSTACAVALAVLAAAALTTKSRAERPRVYAITGATVVTAPGDRVDTGTIVLRDGLIESVGANVGVPPDAVEIDGTGLWVYPGLIDVHTGLGLQSARSGSGGGSGAGGAGASPFGGASRRQTPAGAAHPLPLVRPEKRARDRLLPFEGDRKREAEKYRKQGFTAVQCAADSGVFRGSGVAILLLDETPVPEMILRDDVAAHIGLDRGRFGRGYPTSLMGSAAAIRQVLLDARRHAVWTARYAEQPRGMARPEQVAAFEALGDLVGGMQAAIFHAGSAQDTLLAARLADEFELDAAIHAHGDEWEIAGQVAATGRTLVLPLRFPDKPEVDDDDEALDVSVQQMRRYLEAAAGAAKLSEAGVRFAFTTDGLKNFADLPKNMRKILDAGLSEETALAAWTTVPAALLGIDEVVGTLEPGKVANVVLLDGPLFGEDTRTKRVFVDGFEYKLKEKKKPQGNPNAVVDPRGEWSVVFEMGSRTMERNWTISGEKDAYEGTAETQSGTVSFDDVQLEGNMLTVTFPARGGRGAMELTVIVKGDTFEGSAEFGPRTVPVKGTRTSGPEGGAR